MMKTFFSKGNSVQKMLFLGLFVATFLVSSTTSTLFAQGMTPDHVAKMKAVTSSAISNDGNFVAYTLSVPADAFKENSRNATHLYVLNTTTGESKPYFTSAGASQVTFRPSKGTITFLSRQSGDSNNALYELSLTGGEATKLFSHNTNILNYSWQADGNRLAFSISERDDAPTSPLTYSPDFYEESFSQRKGFVVNLSGNNPQPQQLNVEGSIYLMNWSPDGTKIAISAAPTSSVDDSFMKQRVMVVSSNTRNVLATINNEGKLGQIEWSPDSKWIAIRGAKDIHDPIDGRVLTVSADGGKPQKIDVGFKGKYENISWTGANTIHFLASEGTSSVLGTIRSDGTGKQVIFSSDVHHITSFSRASTGAMSFTANSPQHPTEVFTLGTTRNATPQKRTDNNPWLSEVQLGKQEVVTYKARDGEFDIQGILMYPLNHQAGTAVPLITVVHGGPEAHYTNGWLTAYSIPGQMATAKGYAVFYPNYRGSTGRGTEFTYSSQGDLAGKEFDDIVDGVDYLIAQGIADTNRIGVTGGSYGGYASAWMSTFYSDRFAAAVMFVGISNNISKWGTSDIPEELYLVHSRKRIYDSWQWQLERSPIYYVDRSQTPILIMHGADDPRVHPAQSMELYRHLKVRKPDLPVRLIYYPGEGHGNQRSASKYDYNLRMLQWFDTYLKTGNTNAEKPGLDLPVGK
jgi:dipeptidyl aminopeptidase/acylaminoacyl peptidase